jgi:hypothetical protein
MKPEASPIRIQRSRQHKQVSPNGLPIVYVGRGSRWGNPFRIVKYRDGKWSIKTDKQECVELLVKHCHAIYYTRESAAVDAIKCYELWLMKDSLINDAVKVLRGNNLSCWCRLDEKCHADLLLKLANT